MRWHRLWRDPVFRVGLLLRVALIVLLAPTIQRDLFVPFLTHAFAHPFSGPWTDFLASGGSSISYPYGPVMLLANAPGFALGLLVDSVSGSGYFSGIGLRLSLLLADLAALLLLHELLPGQTRKLIWFYWWSPIALFATYWNGQNDIIPVALLLLSLLMLQHYRPALSGIALGLAFAAKLSMFLAVPFIAVYLWRNKRLHAMRIPFAVGYLVTVALVQGPWLFSSGFVTMVLGTPESVRLFDLALQFGPDAHLYVTPILYLLAVYAVWRLRRISFDLLIATIGLSFFLIVLDTPAPPGWYVWLVPFLVAHQLQGDRSTLLLMGGFSISLIAMHLLVSSGATMPMLGLDPGPAIQRVANGMTEHMHSLGASLIVAAGLVLIAQMLRERVSRNDYYRIAKKPVALGIAGDSGSGKDTLSRALVGLFGTHSVVHVSGDDYHVWDRHGPMWNGLTHLDPRANDLQRFNEDVLGLIDGKDISFRRYDHVDGRFMQPELLASNEVVIASGLHALVLKRLRERFDVAIFLDVDEQLRRNWKIQRDVHQRGHAVDAVIASLARRKPDSDRYIQPQKAAASLVLRLEPVNARHVENGNALRMKLVAILRNSTYHERVARILVGVCGLHLDMQVHDDSGDVEMIIEGDVEAGDIALAAVTLLPDMQEMLATSPQWEGGMTGVMQLLVLVQIEESVKSRIQ